MSKFRFVFNVCDDIIIEDDDKLRAHEKLMNMYANGLISEGFDEFISGDYYIVEENNK